MLACQDKHIERANLSLNYIIFFLSCALSRRIVSRKYTYDLRLIQVQASQDQASVTSGER